VCVVCLCLVACISASLSFFFFSFFLVVSGSQAVLCMYLLVRTKMGVKNSTDFSCKNITAYNMTMCVLTYIFTMKILSYLLSFSRCHGCPPLSLGLFLFVCDGVCDSDGACLFWCRFDISRVICLILLSHVLVYS
jgi:hypothetical protein